MNKVPEGLQRTSEMQSQIVEPLATLASHHEALLQARRGQLCLQLMELNRVANNAKPDLLYDHHAQQQQAHPLFR